VVEKRLRVIGSYAPPLLVVKIRARRRGQVHDGLVGASLSRHNAINLIIQQMATYFLEQGKFLRELYGRLAKAQGKQIENQERLG